MFITYFLSLFPILLILQTGYLSTYASAKVTKPLISNDPCRIFPTCKDINCTLGEYCEMQFGDCTLSKPCCPFPTCYDPCERTVCPINFCLKEPGKVCALRQLKACKVPPCCPDPVCEDPIICSQSDCDIRCIGSVKIVTTSKYVECNTGCACD